MRPLSSHKVSWPICATKIRLRLAAAMTVVFLLIFFSPETQSEGGAPVGMVPAACPAELLKNSGFELPLANPGASPLDWTTDQWRSGAYFSRDGSNAHSGSSSGKITATEISDARFLQEVTVEPETHYLLSGWIKTQNVSEGVGANLSLFGTWSHTEGLLGTNNWTRVSLWFNSGSSTRITIGARLGYWSGPSAGTAWFDDLRLTPITPDGTQPRWKILVLIYDRTDAVVTDTAGVSHHMVAAMTPAEIERATLVATQFVETDIPALTSGNMIPELTIRYPDQALTRLDAYGQGWWPSPTNTARDRDAAFDSVIVIWDPRAVDQYTGIRYWMGGGAAGLGPSMGAGQTYLTIIIEATGYGHRNVFKHEWGHSILAYFDATGATPKPAVTNHANINQYVHWPTGDSYVWVDETDANPIPNSIYNNESGFTHDYYSGTTATADQPTRRLGITPQAWMFGGPVTKPGLQSPGTPPVITCAGDIVVDNEPGSCAAKLTLRPPTVFDACESNLIPAATRSDGAHVDAPYPCGQTIVTWTVTNAANATSTCQQVVTVKDEELPMFFSPLPPLTVMTGPDATSCGAVVDDATLRGAGGGLDPVVLDPIGDIRPVSYPVLPADITSVRSTFNMASLTFTVSFAHPVAPPSSRSLDFIGFIDIDTDQNPATGINSNANVVFTPPVTLGVDFSIDVFSEWAHPGFVDVFSTKSRTIVGRVPIAFTETSLSVTVPLAFLGGDNGAVNYSAYFGVVGTWTDRVPNDAGPLTSIPAPEVIAIDNCSELVFKRVGMPTNNFFPVGETLITYTATDASGNTASTTQTVTVVDNTPPVISGAAANPSLLWPPNHDMVDVNVTYGATDNCAILESWLSVSSNQPGSGSSPDWEIVDAHRVRVRAARSGRWGERLYTITITAKDIHGNLSTQNVIVRVRQGRGQGGSEH